MADIGVDGDALVVRLSRKDKVLAFHREDLRIPVRAIRNAQPVRNALSAVPPLRMPGTGFPGSLAVGTFRKWRNRRPTTFAIVYGNGPGVVIEVEDPQFDRLVLSLDDPDDLLSQFDG
jgi:hypothetical protein